MEETIHINVELKPTDDGHVAIITTRLWPTILRYTLSLTFNPIPGPLVHGTCLTILNNLAIVVEGFVTDLIIVEAKRTGKNVNLNYDRSTWDHKKPAFNRLFEQSIETYPEFKAVEILFALRNNISHGRSHSEESTKVAESNTWQFLKSENKKYEDVRTFLVEEKLLKQKIIPSNNHVFWQPHIAAYFCWQVRSFLNSICSRSASSEIASELEFALTYPTLH